MVYKLEIEGELYENPQIKLGDYSLMNSNFRIEKLNIMYGSLLGFVNAITVLIPNMPTIEHMSQFQHKKWRDEWTKLFKVSPTTLHRVFKSMVFDKWIRPVHFHVMKLYKFCHNTYKDKNYGRAKKQYPTLWKFENIKRVWENLEELEQIKKDGMYNLTPILFKWMPDSVKKVKRGVGKSTWKKLCGNSFYRNMLLILSNFELNIELPSSLLRKGIYLSYIRDAIKIKYINYLVHSGGKYYKDIKGRDLSYAQDLITMVRELRPELIRGDKINRLPQTWENCKKLHDELMIQKEAAKYSNEPIVERVDINMPGWEITPLVSKLDIHLEGKKMHHCVGWYAERVAKREYYIYHIKHIESGEESTLGLDLQTPVVCRLDQHYGPCNSKVNYNEKVVSEIMDNWERKFNPYYTPKDILNYREDIKDHRVDALGYLINNG